MGNPRFRLVYCDTNVYIDFIRMRHDRLRPLGDLAFEFFARGWNCAFHIVLSDRLKHELEKHLSDAEIDSVLSDFRAKDKIHEIASMPEDREEARTYNNPDDAMHAILARNAGADCLVTRNVKHYEDCFSLVTIMRPETV